MIRITADIDSKNKLNLLKRLGIGLLYIKNICKIEIEPSNSKGYHLTFYTKKNYSISKQYKLRKLIGDDKHRIFLDKKRKIGKQTLFSKKYNLSILDEI